MRLLLVEDDAMIGDSVRAGLRRDGFTVDWVRDGRAADLALANAVYDLMLLDLGLPKKDGLDVLRTARRAANRIPVLILTARDSVADRVKGLDAGADDYLVKPFDLDELSARIRALLRRQAGRVEGVIEFGDLKLNPASHEVTLKGKPLALSAREFALLEALLDRPGARVIARKTRGKNCTAGAKKSKAIRSRFTSTRCAKSSGRISSRTSAAWVTWFPQNHDIDQTPVAHLVVARLVSEHPRGCIRGLPANTHRGRGAVRLSVAGDGGRIPERRICTAQHAAG
jgi:two-component system response regulator QseB